MARVLAIGDIHAPATHPGYLQFCRDIFSAWRCDRAVMIGDVLDFHAISFHSREPEAAGADDEAERSQECVDKWSKVFPDADVMIGNHDARVYRLAGSVNIPPRFIRDYSEVWKTPGWRWAEDCHIDGVHYIHGTGFTGKTPALNAALASMQSTVMGHCHSVGGVRWTAGPTKRVFGLDTGCGVDVHHPAMAYGRNLSVKPILSVGVVIDGIPYHEIMPCGPGETYCRARFKARRRK